MKQSLLLPGIIVIALIALLSGCITSSYDTGAEHATAPAEAMPTFSALRTNDTTVMIMLLSPGDAEEIKGLKVVSPVISSPDVIDQNTAVPAGKEIRITDPALSGKVDLVVTTTVNGESLVVLNGTV
ncbi:hypothetical protein [Methanocella arvoryzae]|uniref:Uncharacterized protein n=1 Tax=Methanocella arvoryzae (strain DSM 22066 / NBRC 105507 / MRE50) TaxID=351160 RepID=Q0W2V4_METAR|nr:hypothetical protein [Methanocella arvoryzae]CAJ37289.1 hypothetical protein RCIX2165 [Methanocella arvoryzae MRE50]